MIPGPALPMRPLIILALLVVILVFFSCDRPAPPPPPADSAPSAATAWIEARIPTGMALLTAPARVLVDPASRADVSVPLAARIESVRVREGAVVAVGDPLVDVVMPELVRAAGTWVAAGVRLDAATDRTKRLERLREENLVRSSDLADALADAAQARADRIESESVLRSAGYSGAAAQRLSRGDGKVSLVSPIAGTVVEIAAIPGSRVEPTAGPLVRIVSAGRPRIEARLPFAPPKDVGFRFSARGTSVRVSLAGESPTADSHDGTVLAWFEPAEGEGSNDVASIAPGTPGVLHVEPGADVVAVPARAVVIRDGQSFVLTRSGEANDATPRRVPVTVLASSGAEALVRGELAVGTPVAAEGERLLAAGNGS